MNKKAEVYAKHKSATISSKKVAPVLNLVRGKSVDEAKVILAFDRTKAAKLILKVLKSAAANAKNNLNMDPASMYVSDLHVDVGRTRKTWRPQARGRISPLLKRSCHITVGLSSLGGKPKVSEKVVEKAKEIEKKVEKKVEKPKTSAKKTTKPAKKKSTTAKKTKSKVKKEEKK